MKPAGTKRAGRWTVWAMVIMAAIGAEARAGSLTINASDRGWYNSLGVHNLNNLNFQAGINGSTTFRNFFVFDLSSLGGKTIVSAELIAHSFNATTDDGTETYELRHVSTPIATLVAGGGPGLFGIYNELADGTIYGSVNFGTNDDNIDLSIVLNAAAVADLNAASGLFAFGGQVSTLDDTGVQTIFGSSESGPSSASRLVLSVIPEPTSAMALLALGGAGFARRRGQKRRVLAVAA